VNDPGRLTDAERWASTHGAWRFGAGRLHAALARRFPALIGRGGYLNHAFIEGALAPHLAELRGRDLLELGCAPATLLTRLAERLGAVPHGVDYTAEGVAASRAAFARGGFDPGRVFLADVFDPAFRAAHAARYDAVCSFGFVEHFEQPRDVVRLHLELLRPGGLLVVSAPQFSGVNLRLMRLLQPEAVAEHELSILHLEGFREVFAGLGLQTLACEQVGAFTLRLQGAPARSLRARALAGLRVAELGLDAVRLLRHGARPPAGAASPYLVYVGRLPSSAS
jgi:2-polyprenyl-3-methyl-5-hydroxy-6-metoxy-1,4-benzoquinol methylase